MIFEVASINTQYFVCDKASATSQLIKAKPSDLQKLLKYFSETAISTFKVSTNGCGIDKHHLDFHVVEVDLLFCLFYLFCI